MTDEQKEDLQFWFYNKIFAERQAPGPALAFAAQEVGVSAAEGFGYLVADHRVAGTLEAPVVRSYDRDEADPRGVYVDIEWMLQILHRAGLRQGELWSALGSIYKIPPTLAQQEAADIAIVEGED